MNTTKPTFKKKTLSNLSKISILGFIAIFLVSCSSGNKVLNLSPPAKSMTSHNLKMQGVRAQVGKSVPATTIPVGSPLLPQEIKVTGRALVLGSDGLVSIVNTATDNIVGQILTNAAPPQNPNTMCVINSLNLGLIVSDSPSAAGNALVGFNYMTGQVDFTMALPFQPVAVAATTDGSTALVSGSQGQLASVDLANETISNQVSLSNSNQAYLDGLQITPNQKWAVVVDDGGQVAGNIVYIVNLPTLQVISSVSVGTGSGYFLNSVAVSPDSTIAWVVNGGYGDGQLIPVSIPQASVGGVIEVGGGPLAVSLNSDGSTAYVVDGGVGYGNIVVPVDLSLGFSAPNRTAGTPYQIGGDVNAYLDAIQITADGKYAFVADRENGFLYPVDLSAGLASKPIYVGHSPVAVAIV